MAMFTYMRYFLQTYIHRILTFQSGIMLMNPVGGMAWDDICWWIRDATEKDKLFTRNELADMFPDLLGHIRED